MIAYLNGAWIEEDLAVVPVRDRGFLHADGVFETALLYRGNYFHLDAHLERLAASAALLGVTLPPLPDLARVAREIATRNGLDEGSLRITVTAGSGDRAGTQLVTLSPRDRAWIDKAERGWSIITAATTRPSVDAVPAQLKALGRTYALLARREAQSAGVDDVLLLTDSGMICEGPAWNIFWRTGDAVFTPALELGVLAGITRSVLMDEARRFGYEVHEGAFPRVVLDDADEIFATMTSVGLARFRSLDGRMMPLETPAADRLYERYWAEVAAVCERGGE